jgi:hypothetical protein
VNQLLRRIIWSGFALFVSMSTLAEVRIVDGYVRGLPPSQPVTAAFMRLLNTGNQTVEITSADSDSAERTEFHAHVHRNGMMGMEKVDKLVIAANSELLLAPGEYHLMLINISRPLVDGDKVAIKFSTSDNQQVQVVVPVRSVLNEHKHH